MTVINFWKKKKNYHLILKYSLLTLKAFLLFTAKENVRKKIWKSTKKTYLHWINITSFLCKFVVFIWIYTNSRELDCPGQWKSSHRRCSVRKGVLRNFSKFRGKHLCQSLFFNKAAGLPATLLKKRLWHRCFPMSFVKFLRTPPANCFYRWNHSLFYLQTAV